jgi:hypothetical protein
MVDQADNDIGTGVSIKLLWEMPRASHWAREKSVCFRVIDEMFCNRVPSQFTAKEHGDIAEMSYGYGTVGSLNRCDGLLSRSDTVKEIHPVVVRAVESGLIRPDDRGE